MLICSRAGTREKCPTCFHGKPHEMSVRQGCENGVCFPDIPEETTGVMVKQNYACVEVADQIEPTEVEI